MVYVCTEDVTLYSCWACLGFMQSTAIQLTVGVWTDC